MIVLLFLGMTDKKRKITNSFRNANYSNKFSKINWQLVASGCLIPLNLKTLLSSWNVLRHNTYIIVSCKNMRKKLKWYLVTMVTGETPKNLPKFLKKGKWHKIEIFISFLNDMDLWLKWSRLFIRNV